jgi:hypothetical protein
MAGESRARRLSNYWRRWSFDLACSQSPSSCSSSARAATSSMASDLHLFTIKTAAAEMSRPESILGINTELYQQGGMDQSALPSGRGFPMHALYYVLGVAAVSAAAFNAFSPRLASSRYSSGDFMGMAPSSQPSHVPIQPEHPGVAQRRHQLAAPPSDSAGVTFRTDLRAIVSLPSPAR